MIRTRFTIYTTYNTKPTRLVIPHDRTLLPILYPVTPISRVDAARYLRENRQCEATGKNPEGEK